MKIDRNTIKESEEARRTNATMRGKFARLCIEVDIKKVLVSRVNLEEKNFPVEYEGLHLVCFHCGRYGHKINACTLLLGEKPDPQGGTHQENSPMTKQRTTQKEHATEEFGPWMIVQKNRRPKGVGQHGQGFQGNVGFQNKGNEQAAAEKSTNSGKFTILRNLAVETDRKSVV